jgi:hypothetical protein
MSLTWRQIDAWLELNEKFDRADKVADLVITGVGSQGDQKTFNGLLEELDG